MPGSFPIYDTAMRQLIAWMQPAKAVDIGCGAGKYGRLLAEVMPECQRVGVEVDAGYVESFGLRELYHRVDVADAARWWRQQEDETFDLLLMGDCLEHLPKTEGMDLLNAMVYRCAWLVLLVPEFIVQGAAGGVDSERHRSVWSERDLQWHDLWAWDNARAMSLLVLRGYQPSALTLDDLVARVNEGQLMLLDFDGQTPVRPCRLRLVDHAREVSYRPR